MKNLTKEQKDYLIKNAPVIKGREQITFQINHLVNDGQNDRMPSVIVSSEYPLAINGEQAVIKNVIYQKAGELISGPVYFEPQKGSKVVFTATEYNKNRDLFLFLWFHQENDHNRSKEWHIPNRFGYTFTTINVSQQRKDKAKDYLVRDKGVAYLSGLLEGDTHELLLVGKALLQDRYVSMKELYDSEAELAVAVYSSVRELLDNSPALYDIVTNRKKVGFLNRLQDMKQARVVVYDKGLWKTGGGQVILDSKGQSFPEEHLFTQANKDITVAKLLNEIKEDFEEGEDLSTREDIKEVTPRRGRRKAEPAS